MWVVLFLPSLSAPAVQLSHLPATGNILLCCERFPDCRRGQHQARRTVRAGVADAFGKEISLFHVPAVENPVSALFGIKEYPLGYFFTFPKKYFPKFLRQEYCELFLCVLPNCSHPLAEKKQMNVPEAGI